MVTAIQCIIHMYIVILTMCLQLCHKIEDRKWTKGIQCSGRVIASVHRYRTLRARSVLECASFCRPDDLCLSLIFDVDNSLCQLGNATSYEDCSNTEPALGKIKFYEKTDDSGQAIQSCENGAQLDSHGSCVCVNSFIGTRCERIMGDCTEGRSSGFYTDNGVYDIQPEFAPVPFKVYCLVLKDATRTVVLNREDPTFSFNRSWEEYRQGFGDLTGDFWLGLEKIYQLTQSKNFELRFRIKLNDTIHYSFYESFVVDDQTSGYTFSSMASDNSILADCLTNLQGAHFSAYNADNDDSVTINCASQHGGGWWFKGDNCSLCNPFGPVLAPFDGMRRKGVVGEMFWTGLDDIYPFPISAYLVVVP